MNAIISIIIYVIASLAFIIIGPIVLLITFINPSNSSTYIIPFCKFMIIVFGCKLKVYGDFPKNETFVIMANHVSFLDVFAIPSIFPNTKKFSAISASKNFKIPVFSTFLKKLKVISIDRKNRKQAIQGVQQAEKLLMDNYDIVILPEGTRTLTGNLGPFKKGGFHMAYNTKIPIVPIGCIGAFEFKPKNRWTVSSPRTITVNFGDPMDSASYDQLGVEGLLRKTEEEIKRLTNGKFEDE